MPGHCPQAGAERGTPRHTVVGVWETGEGEQVPPPRQPLPPWRYPHGPVSGNKPAKNLARLPAGSAPGTAAPLIYARAQTLPPAEVHGYPLPKARAGWGCRQKCMLNRQEGAGQGCRQEVRWLECGRQGRGNKFPLPVSPTPRGDIPTVHSMGRSWRRAGYGCSPDIATHGPRPREGAGEERRRHGRGGGCPAEAHGYPCEGAGGVEEAGV